jgi:hypothetical protein
MEHLKHWKTSKEGKTSPPVAYDYTPLRVETHSLKWSVPQQIFVTNFTVSCIAYLQLKDDAGPFG